MISKILSLLENGMLGEIISYSPVAKEKLRLEKKAFTSCSKTQMGSLGMYCVCECLLWSCMLFRLQVRVEYVVGPGELCFSHCSTAANVADDG